MSISVNCPHCAAPLRAPDNSAGRKMKCPKCGTVVVIPANILEVPEFSHPEPIRTMPPPPPYPSPPGEEQESPTVNVHVGSQWPVAIILGIFVGVSLVCCGVPVFLIAVVGIGQKVKEIEQTKQAKQVQEEKPIEISAANLAAEYKDNEARANDNYKGKVVQVTGIIHRITEKRVELTAGHQLEFNRVHCYMENQNVLASLFSGSQITIKGVCGGKELFGVKINQCVLVD